MQDDSQKCEDDLQEQIQKLNQELSKLTPNTRAIDKLQTAEERLKVVETEFDRARAGARKAKEAYETIKQKRLDLFYKAFSHISDQIDRVYKDLTRTAAFPLGGNA